MLTLDEAACHSVNLAHPRAIPLFDGIRKLPASPPLSDGGTMMSAM